MLNALEDEDGDNKLRPHLIKLIDTTVAQNIENATGT